MSEIISGMCREEFYEKHYASVLTYFKRQMGTHNMDCEDLARDVMVKAYKSLPSFEGKSSLASWVRRIAVNYYLDYYRRKRIATFVSLDNMVEDGQDIEYEPFMTDNSSNPERLSSKRETQEIVRKAIRELNKKHKEVIEMHWLSGMSVLEISERLGTPVGTVKSRMFRARNNLKSKLAVYFDPNQGG